MAGECNIAIAGATGEVGRALLEMLDEAGLPIGRLYVLASARSVDASLMFGKRPLLVEELDSFDFSTVDIAVLALPAEVAVEAAGRARDAGCRVIDHSAAFRADASVPLVLGGVVPDMPDAGLVACPGAPAAMLAPLLQTLDDRFGVTFADITMLAPVSLYGAAGVRELAGQTGELLNGRGIEPAVFSAQIAFNALPLVGSSGGQGEPVAPSADVEELQRLLVRPVPLALAVITVPVFYGQTAMVTVHTEADAAADSVRRALEASGAVWSDLEEDQGVATPVTDVVGTDRVYLSGLCRLPAPLSGWKFWVMADNVRQGAAGNSLRILTNWIKDFKY